MRTSGQFELMSTTRPGSRAARRGRVVVALAALFATLAVLGPVRAPIASAQDPAGVIDDAALATLRRAMEDAFLGVQRDHATGPAQLAARARNAPFTGLLDALATAARKEREAPADRLLRALREASARAATPLVSPDTLIVLARETVRRARADAETSGTDIFVAASADVLGAADAADCWDVWFGAAPTVAAWRAAHGAAGARPGADEAPGGDAGEPGSGADPVTDTEPAATTVQETPQVLLERAKVDVGPWEGWIAELGDKAAKTRKVTVRSLWVDTHEVTCAQYRLFLMEQEPAARRELLPAGWRLDALGAAAFPAGRADHPVTDVTYSQARRYAAHLDKRLPTEDEWERIAAAGDPDRTFPWGAGSTGRNWVRGDAQRGTHAVVEENDDASPEGVRGLAGNVAELTATLADGKAIGSRDPPDGSRVVIRGGSYRSRDSECSNRFRWTVEAGEAQAHVGFRCVMEEAAYRKRQAR